MSQSVPELYECSQAYDNSQATQLQTQTQGTQTAVPFPTQLWGFLVSCAPATSAMNLATAISASTGVSALEPWVERPERVDLREGTMEYSIGRLPTSDVVLRGKKISSIHARIFKVEGEEGGIMLQDLSTNGTFVLGQKVGKNKVTRLESGNEIVFGPASSTFVNDFRYIFQSKTVAIPTIKGDGGGIHALYDIRDPIGKGSFATVKRGIERLTGKMVAIKIIDKARFASGTLKLIAREVEIMKALDHKYCIKYIDYFEDSARMYLVLEYSGGGDLLQYVMDRNGLSESETREIALMVCEAVAYLHSKGVAHRDIKPENLLLSTGTRPICKVTDFGLAKMSNDQTMLKTMCGTPSYLAPEVITNASGSGSYALNVDAWSIGIVLYCCLSNQSPFDESETTPLPERIRARKIDYNVIRETGCSEIGIDFLSRLLTIDPAKRMTVEDAMNHRWLAIASSPATGRLPLISLPFNPSTKQGTVPSVTSPSMSMQSSFGYSQQMDNLKLETPGRRIIALATPEPEAGIGPENDSTTIRGPSPNKRGIEPASAFSSLSSIGSEAPQMEIDSPAIPTSNPIAAQAEERNGQHDSTGPTTRRTRISTPESPISHPSKSSGLGEPRRRSARSSRGTRRKSEDIRVVGAAKYIGSEERVTRSKRKVARLS